MSFWGELKRRNVYKVGVAYAIVAWLLIQASSIIFPHMRLPEWAVPFVIVLLIIGFPLILLFAWAFEITPEGIKRTKEVPLSESIIHLTGKKLNYILAGLLVLAVAFLLFDNYYLDRRAIEKEIASIEPEQAPIVSDIEEAPKTIAVLPFDNLSSDPEQEYFVLGLSEEILNSLCQIPDLGVAGRTSSFSFKESNKTIQEIAGILGVENVLEGSVRKSGNALRITAQLVRAADGLHLWSKTYDRELKDIFQVQEEIATAVANELKVKLGIDKSFKQLGGTENVEAYELFLVAQGLIGQGSANDFTYTILEQESIDEAIAIDPKFARAWVHKARIHNYWGLVKPAKLTAAERDIALNAVSRAIELEPNLAAGHYYLGGIKTANGDFIGGELAIRKALELSTESFWETTITARGHYWPVGYLKRAHEIIEESRRSDPLNHDNRESYISSLALLGDTQQAEEEYKRIRGLVGENHWDDMTITDVRLGIKEILSSDDIIYSDPVYDVAKINLDSPKEGLSELRRLYADDDITYWFLSRISMWAAYFGDPDFAMRAMEKGVNVDASFISISWWPVMKEVRQLPRFKEFIKEIGLVDYWSEFGWPDICRPLDNGDFVCD